MNLVQITLDRKVCAGSGQGRLTGRVIRILTDEQRVLIEWSTRALTRVRPGELEAYGDWLRWRQPAVST